MPIIPDTLDAEAGESLEPWMWRLQSVEVAPSHPSLGDRAGFYLKKKGMNGKGASDTAKIHRCAVYKYVYNLAMSLSELISFAYLH